MTEQTGIEIKLEKGKEYEIELYPTPQRTKVIYEKEYRGMQIFFNSDGYFILDSHWMIERDGILTYKDVSSASYGGDTHETVRRGGGIEKVIDRYLGRIHQPKQ